MAKRISRQQLSRHKVIDYFELGKFIEKRKNDQSLQSQELIDSKAISFGIKPSEENYRRAMQFSVRFNRELLQQLISLPVANSNRPLPLGHFVVLLELHNTVAMEQMARAAAEQGLDRNQFREHINRELYGIKSQRPGAGRTRRKFASTFAALTFCRDQLEALKSAMDDIAPGLTTDQHRRNEALKKAFERASTALKSLAKSCAVELDPATHRSKKSRVSKNHMPGLEFLG